MPTSSSIIRNYSSESARPESQCKIIKNVMTDIVLQEVQSKTIKNVMMNVVLHRRQESNNHVRHSLPSRCP